MQTFQTTEQCVDSWESDRAQLQQQLESLVPDGGGKTGEIRLESPSIIDTTADTREQLRNKIVELDLLLAEAKGRR
jgi:hypothetical protein